MKSAVLPSFWTKYISLSEEIRRSARKAYQLWRENPFHPSLHFKCINREENIWSVRITLGYRAIGILDADTITWFWIGNHDEYERFFSYIMSGKLLTISQKRGFRSNRLVSAIASEASQ